MAMKVGDTAALTVTVSDEMVRRFSELTGDRNPVHLDDAFAQRTRFGQRIAHGMIAASQISAVIGNTLPGPGAIYLSQTLQFLAPVFIGDTVKTTVTVKISRKGSQLRPLKRFARTKKVKQF